MHFTQPAAGEDLRAAQIYSLGVQASVSAGTLLDV